MNNAKESAAGGICGVCGDRARCRHFGGMACEGCKAFFRRAVQSGSYKTFSCDSGHGKCNVTKPNRRKCQGCRFLQCRKNGMEPKWVMGETERTALKLSKIAKQVRGAVFSPITFTSLEEIDLATSIVKKYQDAVIRVPMLRREPQSAAEMDKEVADIFVCGMLRMLLFVSQIPEFLNLHQGDAEILMRESLLPTFLIRTAFSIDTDNMLWPKNHVIESFNYYPPRKMDAIYRATSFTLREKFRRFAQKLNDMQADEQCVMFLVLVILFRSDLHGLTDHVAIDNLQNRFLHMFRKYLIWAYGDGKATTVFPKLLALLPDLREIDDSHDETNFVLRDWQVETLRENLGSSYPFKNILIRNSFLEDLDEILQVRPENHSPAAESTSSDTDELYDLIGNVDIMQLDSASGSEEEVEKWLSEISV